MDQYPLMLGHEAVGEVVEVGADVKTYHIGDKVLLPFVDPDRRNMENWALPGVGTVSMQL